MNDHVALGMARIGRAVRKLARRLGARVPRVTSSGPDGEPQDAPPERTESPSFRPVEDRPTPSPAKQLKQVRITSRKAVAELKGLKTERARLLEERLSLQQLLGQQHGRTVMPRLKVEKTNGRPSFVVGQRMMQRVHRRALDPVAGLDNVGAVFADPQQTARFARSHSVPCAGERASRARDDDPPESGAPTVIVHALKGEVGLVEVRGMNGARHFDDGGADLGDIRSASTYDPTLEPPERFDDLCGWSRVLSAAIPRPYAQLFFRSEAGGPELDFIDVDPDRIPVLTPEWDERLGSMFDAAYSRFLLQPYRSGALANRVPGGFFTYEEGA